MNYLAMTDEENIGYLQDQLDKARQTIKDLKLELENAEDKVRQMDIALDKIWNITREFA